MKRHPFAVGVLTGFAITWAWHHFARPLPGGSATGSLSGRS